MPKGAFYSQPDRPRIPLDNRPGILKPNEVCEYIFLVLFIYMQTNAGAVVIDAIGSLIGFKRANRLANRGFTLSQFKISYFSTKIIYTSLLPCGVICDIGNRLIWVLT